MIDSDSNKMNKVKVVNDRDERNTTQNGNEITNGTKRKSQTKNKPSKKLIAITKKLRVPHTI